MKFWKPALILGCALIFTAGQASALIVDTISFDQNGSTQTTIYSIVAETGDSFEAFQVEFDETTTNLEVYPTLKSSDWIFDSLEPSPDPSDPSIVLPWRMYGESLAGPLAVDGQVFFTLSYDTLGSSDFGQIFEIDFATGDVIGNAITPAVAGQPQTSNVPEPGVFALLVAGFVGFRFSKSRSLKLKLS